MMFEAIGDNSLVGLMGARNNATTECYAIWLFNGNQVGAQWENNSYDSSPITIDYHQLLCYDYNKYNFYVNTTKHQFSSDVSPAPTCNLTLFAVNTNGVVDSRRVSGKFYGCKIYDNETLIREYIPYVYKGKACLYDKVNDTYTFSSDNTFIAGPKKTEIPWQNIISEQSGDITFYQEVLPNLNPGETINIFADFTNESALNLNNRIFGFTFKNTYSTSTAYTIGSNGELYYIPRLFTYDTIVMFHQYTTYASLDKYNIGGHKKVIISVTRGKTTEENATLMFYLDGLAGEISTDNLILDDAFESGLKIFNADESLESIGFNGTYHDISIFKGTLTDLQKRTITFN